MYVLSTEHNTFVFASFPLFFVSNFILWREGERKRERERERERGRERKREGGEREREKGYLVLFSAASFCLASVKGNLLHVDFHISKDI